MILSGTGHRPQYLPCKYDETNPRCKSLKSLIIKELHRLQPEKVISGIALGFDIWLAEAAIYLKIPLVAYIPYKGQGDNWPIQSRNRRSRILEQADSIKIFSETYKKECFMIRNKAMVDDSEIILALLNTQSIYTGTFSTVKYAASKDKFIVNLWKKLP